MKKLEPNVVVKKMAAVILYAVASLAIFGWAAPELVSADNTELSILGGVIVLAWVLFSAWIGLRIAANKFNQNEGE